MTVLAETITAFDKITSGTITAWHDGYVWFGEWYTGPSTHFSNFQKRKHNQKRREVVTGAEFLRTLQTLNALAVVDEDDSIKVTRAVWIDTKWPTPAQIASANRYEAFSEIGSAVRIGVDITKGEIVGTVGCFPTAANAVYWKVIRDRDWYAED